MSCSTQGVKDVYSLLNLCPYGFLSLLSNYLEPLIFNKTHGFSYLKWNNYGSKPQFVTNMYNNHTSLCQYEIVTRWIVCFFYYWERVIFILQTEGPEKIWNWQLFCCVYLTVWVLLLLAACRVLHFDRWEASRQIHMFYMSEYTWSERVM